MGTLHTIFVLDEVVASKDGIEWLASWGIPIPDNAPPGRLPRLSDLKYVLSSTEGYDIDYEEGSEHLNVTITSKHGEAWAHLVVTDIDKQMPSSESLCEMSFEAGWPGVIREIIQSLAERCGPFVWTKNGENPEILMPS